MKNKIRLMLTSVALLAASSAFAGIVFLPAGGQYIDPGLAQVSIENLGEQTIRIRTTGLQGRLAIDRADFPPEPIQPNAGKLILQFTQQLQLTVESDTGLVTGRTRGLITSAIDPQRFEFRADVRGTASCLPYSGQACGRIVFDLEVRGGLMDTVDPASVGQIRMAVLGSFIRGDQNSWAALDANITLGANEALINTLTSMGEGEVGV